MDQHFKAHPVSRRPLAANDGSAGPSHFNIYRADRVCLTSTLFAGGDWHWRLTAATGGVIADCGGYRNEAQCLAAVESLRSQASGASVHHNG
jgi:uncharacterized protein YegP (UPF0339 family)